LHSCRTIGVRGTVAYQRDGIPPATSISCANGTSLSALVNLTKQQSLIRPRPVS
jgi:hypothetical protein